MRHLQVSGAIWGAVIAVVVVPGFAAPTSSRTVSGERLDPSTYGPGVVESMAEVKARDRLAPRKGTGKDDDPRFRYGEWVVPSRRATTYPNSGEHNVVNKVGDIRMGIGFPEVVDVNGAYFAGQAADGAWTTGILVVGYLDGKEVGRTGWFRDIGDEPSWFEMDLCGVNRIVILCEPVLEGAGWYGMDDLTFAVVEPYDRGPTVVDFEDVSFNTPLSGSNYAGLTWEFGTGFSMSEPVHAPQVPPDLEPLAEDGNEGVGRAGSRDSATLPDLVYDFRGVIRGQAGSWTYPPDSMGAIGPDHYVVVVNRNIAIYDRYTGGELSNVYLGSFLPGSNGDPRVLFDQHSNRWFLLASDFSSGQHTYLAVSTTSDPTGSWFKTSFSTDQGSDVGKWPDYPTLGVDANGVYTAAYMVGGTNKMTLWAIDKAPLIAPTPTLGTVTAFRELRWEGAIQPAHTYGTPDGEYCVSVYGSTSLRVRRVDPPLTAPTLTEVGFVTVPYQSSPPTAPALGSFTNLDTVGNRLMMSVYRDGSLWTTHTINSDGRAAARWYQIEPATLTLEQSGTVADSTLHYFFPSIMVNRHGHVAMGFTGSSSSVYAGAYYTGRWATDPAGEMGPPVLYRAGAAPYNNVDPYGRNRWGDYSHATLDPTNSVWIWTIQEYVESEDIWGTQVGVLAAGDACTPPMVEAEGCRTLLVTPQGDESQALLVTGDPDDPTVSCVSAYVQADGTLGPDPVFQTPAAWGVAAARGAELVPEATYYVHADCGLPGSPEPSAPSAATLWKWGDVELPPNGVVGLGDILHIIFAYQGNYANVTLERADIDPCVPNRVIGVGDILGAISAFQGVTFDGGACSLPCP